MPSVGLFEVPRDPELPLARVNAAAGLRGPDPGDDAISRRVDLRHQLVAATKPDESRSDCDVTAEDGFAVHLDGGDDRVRCWVDAGHRSGALIHDPYAAFTHGQEPWA